jgi:hypothetical protein
MKHFLVSSIVASMLVVPRPVYAFEAPRTPLSDALRAGRIAFVGRVVQLQEVSRSSEHEASALARFVVARCLYGRSCNEKTIEMEYTLDTQQDRRLGVDFMLGENYLVIIKKEGQGRLRFGSDWADSMDIAYRLIQPLETSDRPISFVNVWRRNLIERLPAREVLRWASQRRQALSRGE